MTKRKELARLRQYASDLKDERDAWQAKYDRANRTADDLQAMLDHARRQRDELKTEMVKAKEGHSALSDLVKVLDQEVAAIDSDRDLIRADLECARVDLKRVIEVGNRLAANDHRHTRAHRDWRKVTAPIVADLAVFPSEATQ